MKEFTNKIFNYFGKKYFIKDIFRIMRIMIILLMAILLLRQEPIYNGLKICINKICFFDEKYPGVLSLLGALIGFLGVMLVFILQEDYQKRRDRKRLMYLLLTVYENLSSLYSSHPNVDKYLATIEEYKLNPDTANLEQKEELIKISKVIEDKKNSVELYREQIKRVNDKILDLELESKLDLELESRLKLKLEELESKLNLELESLKSQENLFTAYNILKSNLDNVIRSDLEKFENLIVYDTEWRKLVVSIKEIEESDFLRNFLLKLENVHIYKANEIDERLKRLKRILKRYGFKRHVKYIDKKINQRNEEMKKKRKKKINSDTQEHFYKRIKEKKIS